MPISTLYDALEQRDWKQVQRLINWNCSLDYESYILRYSYITSTNPLSRDLIPIVAMDKNGHPLTYQTSPDVINYWVENNANFDDLKKLQKILLDAIKMRVEPFPNLPQEINQMITSFGYENEHQTYVAQLNKNYQQIQDEIDSRIFWAIPKVALSLGILYACFSTALYELGYIDNLTEISTFATIISPLIPIYCIDSFKMVTKECYSQIQKCFSGQKTMIPTTSFERGI